MDLINNTLALEYHCVLTLFMSILHQQLRYIVWKVDYFIKTVDYLLSYKDDGDRIITMRQTFIFKKDCTKQKENY